MRAPAHYALNIALFVALFVASAWFLSNYLIYQVASGSMEPTFCTDTYVVVKKRLGAFAPRVGEVVLFKMPPSSVPVMKRIVGTGGQIVRTDSDSAIVDGITLSEPYLCTESAEHVPAQRAWSVFKAIPVPQNEVFVMGDNRSRSEDSRNYGPISVDSIVGEVSFNIAFGSVGRHCSCGKK